MRTERAGRGARTRFFTAEVIQASMMDCGPACLASALESFGIPFDYEKLRTLCQISLDGTSIDQLEAVANQLGLEAEQVMLPADDLFVPGTESFPAFVVTLLPTGATHFVLAWRRHGPWTQVMNPSSGRQWKRSWRFATELYQHQMLVEAPAWREWAGSPGACLTLRAKARSLGLSQSEFESTLSQALADPGWREIASLDAALRLTGSVVEAGGIDSGTEAEGLFRSLLTDPFGRILPSFWAVRESGDDLLLRGAVLVKLKRAENLVSSAAGEKISPRTMPQAQAGSSAWASAWKILDLDPKRAGKWLSVALGCGALATLLEALLFRGAIDLSTLLQNPGQRFLALAAWIVFLAALLCLEFPVSSTLWQLGRRLEQTLRAALLERIPRLPDSFFRTRAASDLAERGHSLHRIRELPVLTARLLRLGAELGFTAIGLALIYPPCAPLAILLALCTLGFAALAEPVLAEKSLKLRTHQGALTRFYFDAFLGLTAIRSQGAEKNFQRQYRALLGEWKIASLQYQRVALSLQALQSLLGFSLGAWMLERFLSHSIESGGVLLAIYWVLKIPSLGQSIAQVLSEFPHQKSSLTRALEPLRVAVPDEPSPFPLSVTLLERGTGVAIEFEKYSITLGGIPILHELSFRIAPGEHLAVIGASGAGKSSLAAALLGLYRSEPGQGRLLIDGEEDSPEARRSLEGRLAWVDPSVQLWNRSLLENLRYGYSASSDVPLQAALDQAELQDVLEALPEGLVSPLGEGGTLLSGGEGQRVRLARAMMLSRARLVVLDEPFRGLPAEKRKVLLARIRTLWKGATLILITHDPEEAATLERVMTLGSGQILEDGNPQSLVSQASSKLSEQLRAAGVVRTQFWDAPEWRKLRMRDGEAAIHEP
ncbi:MAG: ATP-binding cassette domain-containing protein [Bdellovibrionota bacterium]